MPLQQTPIITKRHTDSNGNYTTNKIVGEVKQIVKKHVLLEEIPHPHLGITVVNTNDNTILKEVDYTEHLSNKDEYKIDYSEGKVWFHPSLEAQKVSVDYYGIGYDMINVNRVYTQINKETGDVIETLGDILDYAVVIIEELGEVKDAVLRGEILLEELYEECDNAIELLDKLGIDIEEGSTLDTLLKTTILEAKGVQESLSILTQYANEKIEELNRLNADVGEMLDISNNHHLLEVKNNLQLKIDAINEVLKKLEDEGASHNHDSLYLKLDGSSPMNGGIILPQGFTSESDSFGIDANNSDIINVNTLNFGEGKEIHFVENKLFIGENEVWTSNNQGENSNLDADTLDGLDSTDFLQIGYVNGYNGIKVGEDDRQALRTTKDGLLPYDSNMSSLGNSGYPFLEAYVNRISNCHTLHMAKNGSKSTISFEAPYEKDSVFIEHSYSGESSTYKVSMGNDGASSDSFRIGNQLSSGFNTLFSVQGDGVTATKDFSINGKRIYIQSGQPANAPEGSIWFQY